MSDAKQGGEMAAHVAAVAAAIPQLIAWWESQKVDMPWRSPTPDPYAVWISEIMLQQTQVATVIPYFERWMTRFPTVAALAAADLADVLKMWEGLGYYSRARNLHTAAQMVIDAYGGELPNSAAELRKLKGIGRYTAGAIASIAFGEQAAVLDGNVIRVLTRLFDISADITQTATKNNLWEIAEALVPGEQPGAFNQALMELGQQICVPETPRCLLCPITAVCLARQRGTQHERPVRPPRKATPHYAVAAGVVWLKAVGEGAFLIAQRPLDGLLGGLWEFPGGKQEAGETLPQTLVREIKEELAIDIEVAEAEPFVIVKHAYTHFRITLHAFQARFLGGEVAHLGAADHAWVTLTDIDRYAFAVTDRKIIAAVRRTASANGKRA